MPEFEEELKGCAIEDIKRIGQRDQKVWADISLKVGRNALLGKLKIQNKKFPFCFKTRSWVSRER